MQAMNGLGNMLGGLMGRPEAPPAPAAPAAPSETLQEQQRKEELLALVDRRYRYARDSKHYMLPTWATCLAFFVGEQWRSWNKEQRRMVELTHIPSWRVLPVYNQLPGIMDTAASKLSRSRQLPKARPDDAGDPMDQERAEKATHALRAWWNNEDLELRDHEANVTRLLFGCAFFHVYWDPSRLVKVPVPDPMTGQVRSDYAPAGDVCVEVLSPFDVFPEPVERWDDVSWVLIARQKPVWWFEETFGVKVEAETSDPDCAFSSLLPGVVGADANTAASPPAGDGQATLKIYYERPSAKHAQGRTIYTAGKQVLYELDALPLPLKGLRHPLPVKMYPYRFVPKRLWPKGLIEETISPQRELNRGLGNLAELFRLFRSPKRWVDKSWKLSPDAITTQPDEIVEGTFGGANPTQWVEQPPNLPAWVSQYAEVQRNELRHTAGQHEVSEGMVPSGVSAASAISLLQNAENVRLNSPMILGQAALQALLKHVLTVQAERYREPRRMSVPDRRGDLATVDVLGEEIGPLEVFVEISEGAEDNDAVRQEQLAVWWPMIQDPMTWPLLLPLLKDIGLSWIADVVEQSGPQVQQAQMQQMLMQAAMQPEQPDPAQDPRLQAQGEDREAKAQLERERLQHEAHQKTLDRRHDLKKARLLAAQKAAKGGRR